jgi:two-component system CheB/CheR fusion protein
MITEDSEAHREELQSANEEILSSNEELKSINEELETSKEELQSSNEELTTINEELLIRNIDLKEAVEYSEAIIQTITEPLVVLNADMRIRTANKAFYKSFQLRPADTEGNYFYETANGQWNIPELRKELDSIVHKDKSFENFELSHDFPAIGQRTLLFNAMRMSIDNNKGRRFLLAIQDITDRVTNLRELSYTKEYFRLLVQNAFDVITIFSPNGDIKYQSESMKRVLGYSPEESIGTNIFTDGIAHPDDLAIKREWFATCKATPNEPISQEFRLRHKDGTYKYIDAVCINLLDNPFINGIVGNYRDITNQKSLERQREEFIGIASHELRTPVTSIKGYTQLIQATLSGSGATQAGEFTEKLHKQVDRLMHLIEKLLDVTRISGGQLQLQLSTFDINDLLKERADELSQTTSANIIMELQECPVIRADRERIGQVITNLLSNAVKYSPPNEKIIIRTSFQSGVGAELYKVTVSIRDFGGGISETMQSAIFDRFFRVKDANTNIIPGLGLGL